LTAFREIEMDDHLTEVPSTSEQDGDLDERAHKASEDLAKLRDEFEIRLVAAHLRTEAVRAGMVDLDGLKMIDVSAVRLGSDDNIVGGRKLMDDLRRNKPWLFAVTSSSSSAIAPASRPVRQKSALEMTDEEYAAARTAVTKQHF
jgi:hypothetical protein